MTRTQAYLAGLGTTPALAVAVTVTGAALVERLRARGYFARVESVHDAYHLGLSERTLRGRGPVHVGTERQWAFSPSRTRFVALGRRGGAVGLTVGRVQADRGVLAREAR